MYYTYILRSQKNGRYYTGSTQNVEKRLSEHNAGASASTRYTRPFVLIHREAFPARRDAVRRERFLKTGVGRKWIEDRFGRAVAGGDR